MYAAGFSLDNISLMALTISVGFVVDDAIVMIENIVRYIEQGERPLQAALRGAGQIGFTIISITFSLIAVFIPLFFMGGIIGRLFREFAVTVSVAVVASAVVSLTLTPVLCSLFLKQHERACRRPAQPAGGALLQLDAGRLRPGAALRVPPPVPDAADHADADRGHRLSVRDDPERASSRSRTPASSSARWTRARMPRSRRPRRSTHQIVDIVTQDPAVQDVFSLGGAYAYNPTENTARVFIQLKPFDERDVTADQVIQRLRPQGCAGARAPSSSCRPARTSASAAG